jgi:hypothetical protein
LFLIFFNGLVKSKIFVLDQLIVAVIFLDLHVPLPAPNNDGLFTRRPFYIAHFLVYMGAYHLISEIRSSPSKLSEFAISCLFFVLVCKLIAGFLQVGEDAHGLLIRNALASSGVQLDYLRSISEPTGHAVVMLQPGGQNSIIIVGGANISWPTTLDGGNSFPSGTRELIHKAGALLLQREVPDAVNIEAAKVSYLISKHHII